MVMSLIFTGILLLSVVFAAITGQGAALAAAAVSSLLLALVSAAALSLAGVPGPVRSARQANWAIPHWSRTAFPADAAETDA